MLRNRFEQSRKLIPELAGINKSINDVQIPKFCLGCIHKNHNCPSGLIIRIKSSIDNFYSQAGQPEIIQIDLVKGINEYRDLSDKCIDQIVNYQAKPIEVQL